MSSPPLTPEELAVLRIAAARPCLARAAWAEFVDLRGAHALSPHLRDLLPAAANRVADLGLSGPDGLMRELRVARVIEARRDAAFQAVAGGILSSAAIKAIDPVMIDGFGLARRHYPATDWRHASRIDLLVSSGADLESMAAVLARSSAGWTVQAISAAKQLRMRHPSGLPVRLWRGLVRLGDVLHEHSALRHSAEQVTIGNATAHVPCDRDEWRLIACRASRARQPGSLLWLLDAAMLARRAPPQEAPESVRRAVDAVKQAQAAISTP